MESTKIENQWRAVMKQKSMHRNKDTIEQLQNIFEALTYVTGKKKKAAKISFNSEAITNSRQEITSLKNALKNARDVSSFIEYTVLNNSSNYRPD